MLSRRTEVYLEYNNKNISADIKAYLLDFSFQDNEDKADDLQIKLEDKSELWQKEWFPEKGAKIKANIITRNYDSQGQVKTLPCGTFEIDEIGCNGPPSTVDLKAVSIPVTNNINTQKNTKAWENISLSNIVGEVAANNGMNLMLDIDEDIHYDRIDQNQESDLVFLKRLCKESGLGVKVTGFKVVIFDELKYQNKATVRSITKGEPSVLSYDFNSNSLSAYKAAEVSYKDSSTGKVEKTKRQNKSEKVSGKTLKINKRVKSKKQAEKTADKALQNENKKTNTAKFTLAGDIELAAKQTIDVVGWGNFDGKYIINSATHKVGSGGYLVDIDCSKVN